MEANKNKEVQAQAAGRVTCLTLRAACDILVHVSTSQKTLARMRHNPRDWRIEQLEAVAAQVGLTTRKQGGSHVVFQKSGCPLEVSVPAHRPIKPVYVTHFLALVDWRQT